MIGRPPTAVPMDTVRELRAAGATWAEVARATGFHRNTILSHRQRHGVRVKDRSLAGERERERTQLGPEKRIGLAEADRLRATGTTWSVIARKLGVSVETLLKHRKRNAEPRGALPSQRRLVLAASRFLRANLGEGLTPVEFTSAKGLVDWLRALHRENGELRVALTKSRQRVRDLERMLAR